jgi:hypothetical protein
MTTPLQVPYPRLTVTIAPTVPAARTVLVSEIQAARRTHVEMLRIVDELTRATAGQPHLHAVLRSAQGMARSVAARLADMEG